MTSSIKETDLSGNGRDCVKAPDDQTTALTTVRACSILIAKNPSWDARYYERRGYAYFELGLNNEAIADLSLAAGCPQSFRKEGTLAPDSLFELLRIRGMAYARSGNYASAQKDFNELLGNDIREGDKGLLGAILHDFNIDRSQPNYPAYRAIKVAHALAYSARADLNLDPANALRDKEMALNDSINATSIFKRINDDLVALCKSAARSRQPAACSGQGMIRALLSSAHQSEAAAWRAAQGRDGDPDHELSALFDAAAAHPVARAEVRKQLGAISARRRPSEIVRFFGKHAEAGVPASIEFLVFRAQAHLALGDKAAAVRDYDRAIKLAGNEADLFFGRAGAHLAQSDRTAALADLNAAIQRDPATPAFLMARGKVRLEMGDATAAIADYDAAIRLAPGLAEAYVERSSAHRTKRATASADADLEQALRIEPESVMARTARALVNVENRDWKAALSDLDVAVKVDAAGPAGALRGVVRAASGDHAGAISDFNIVLDTGSRDATLFTARAKSELAIGQANAALGDLQRALEIDPKHKVALTTRELVYQALGGAPKVAAEPKAAPVAKPVDPASQLEPGKSLRDLTVDGQPCPQCPELVVVPAGRFMMGAAPGELGAGPQRQVTIQRVAIGKFKVTFDQWAACFAGGGCAKIQPPEKEDRPRKGELPVVEVTWHEAKEYAAWLSRTTGRNYRLLTDAEWEYAAREGTTNPLWRPPIPPDRLNTVTYEKYQVGASKPNKFGLHDVFELDELSQENVTEWVEDCGHANFKGAPIDGSAWTTSCLDDDRRVVRGRMFRFGRGGLERWDSYWMIHNERSAKVGFRIARTIDGEARK